MIPYTDYECRLALDELYRGDKVVIPSSLEHAKFMKQVAENYIHQCNQKLLDTIKGSDDVKTYKR
jgi:hypothetical protein